MAGIGATLNEDELKARTKRFALDIIGLVEGLPARTTARTIGNQLLRAGMSVGANYRAACRGRSKADFIAKLGIAFEEADESLYWMELLMEAGITGADRLVALRKEANELVSIFHASIKTARANR
ncbi:MAG TPA: four helix bundle protein [Anaerolineales bacterium]